MFLQFLVDGHGDKLARIRTGRTGVPYQERNLSNQLSQVKVLEISKSEPLPVTPGGVIPARQYGYLLGPVTMRAGCGEVLGELLP